MKKIENIALLIALAAALLASTPTMPMGPVLNRVSKVIGTGLAIGLPASQIPALQADRAQQKLSDDASMLLLQLTTLVEKPFLNPKTNLSFGNYEKAVGAFVSHQGDYSEDEIREYGHNNLVALEEQKALWKAQGATKTENLKLFQLQRQKNLEESLNNEMTEFIMPAAELVTFTTGISRELPGIWKGLGIGLFTLMYGTVYARTSYQAAEDNIDDDKGILQEGLYLHQYANHGTDFKIQQQAKQNQKQSGQPYENNRDLNDEKNMQLNLTVIKIIDCFLEKPFRPTDQQLAARLQERIKRL